MSTRRKHGWPFWFAVWVVALALYLLSLGPVHALAQHFMVSVPTPLAYAIMIYRWPMELICTVAPEWFNSLLEGYIVFWFRITEQFILD